MPATRRHRIVRRAMIALVVLAGVWLTMHEPPEIEQSRAIRLGMTEAEVESIMGGRTYSQVERYGGDYRQTLLYGRSQRRTYELYDALRSWSGELLPAWFPSNKRWPVRVRIDRRGGRVDRIERGDSVEESKR